MRHQNLASTAIYTAVADEQRTKGMQLLDPFRVATMEPVAQARDVTAEQLRRRSRHTSCIWCWATEMIGPRPLASR
jgi:hypothetical protein